MATYGPRDRADERLATELAAGSTVKAAAAAAGLRRRTAARRLRDPEFVAMLDGLRADHLREAGSRLARAATAAVDRLVALADGATSEGVQLRAAALVLEMGLRIRDAIEVDRRLAELEARFDARERGDPLRVHETDALYAPERPSEAR